MHTKHMKLAAVHVGKDNTPAPTVTRPSCRFCNAADEIKLRHERFRLSLRQTHLHSYEELITNTTGYLAGLNDMVNLSGAGRDDLLIYFSSHGDPYRDQYIVFNDWLKVDNDLHSAVVKALKAVEHEHAQEQEQEQETQSK